MPYLYPPRLKFQSWQDGDRALHASACRLTSLVGEANMVKPVRLGSDQYLAVLDPGAGMQRALRHMSLHPEDARTFSQQKILIGIGVPFSLLMTLIMYFPISEYLSGQSDDIYAIIVPGAFTLFCYSFALMGLFRRFGVDRDKVWTRFGKLFYRQVRFSEIDRFDTGINRFKVYAKGTKINLDYNRFDYSLVLIRLLEELQYRKFQLQNVHPDHPAWEATAQVFRNDWGSTVYAQHQAFYDARPRELERLNNLIYPPQSYSKATRSPHMTSQQLDAMTFGDIHAAYYLETVKGIFGRTKERQRVIFSAEGKQASFELSELRTLAAGPVLLEAVSGVPAGEFFLATAQLINAHSPMAQARQHTDALDLVFVHGTSRLAILTVQEQSELIAWLASLPGSEAS